MTSSAQDSVFATVLVGPNHARFVVHEALLVHHSEFFRAALTGNFKEAEEKVVKMADTEPYIFECFVHWLYYQRFPDASKGDDEELVKIWGSADEAHTLITNLVKIYVMGDQNIMPRLQRDALDSVFHHISYTHCTLPDDDHVKCAFDYLDPEDPLCRYLVDANFYGDNCLDDDFNPYDISENFDWPIEYLLALARRSTNLVSQIRWGDKNIGDFEPELCNYHDHKTVEERKACENEQINKA
jgi:hypothetical protein